MTFNKRLSQAVQVFLGATLLFLFGCGSSEAEDDSFVARVNAAALSQEEVDLVLANMTPGLDSVNARKQYIDQWITNELLAQEARRRSLQDIPEIRQKIIDSERSVLITSLVNRLQDETEPPTEADIQAYFEQNINNLVLREPFLRIRYLTSADSALAHEAHGIALTLPNAAQPDSLWRSVIATHAADTSGALVLSFNFYPESRLFRNIPNLARTLPTLRPGQTAPLIRHADQYHILQLVERVPTGTLPRLAWVRDEVRNHLLIQARKQVYIDHVTRLRNEALARGTLEINVQE